MTRFFLFTGASNRHQARRGVRRAAAATEGTSRDATRSLRQVFYFFTFTFFLRLFTIGASQRYPDLGPAPRELTDAAKGAVDADAVDDPTRDAVKKVRRSDRFLSYFACLFVTHRG